MVTTVARDAVAREAVARDAVAREAVAMCEIDLYPHTVARLSLLSWCTVARRLRPASKEPRKFDPMLEYGMSFGLSGLNHKFSHDAL